MDRSLLLRDDWSGPGQGWGSGLGHGFQDADGDWGGIDLGWGELVDKEDWTEEGDRVGVGIGLDVEAGLGFGFGNELGSA